MPRMPKKQTVKPKTSWPATTSRNPRQTMGLCLDGSHHTPSSISQWQRMRKALATAVMKCPVKRASRSDTIFFGRPCVLNTCLPSVIDGKFCDSEIGIPIVLIRVDIMSQHVLQCSVQMFCLTIRLWMEICGQCLADAQSACDSGHEMSRKSGVGQTQFSLEGHVLGTHGPRKYWQSLLH